MRHTKTLVLAGLLGGLLMAGEASACHKKKCPCPPPAPVCEPVVCAPAPVVCEPAPVVCEAPKKKHHFKMPKMKFGCHKKAECAPVSYTYTECAPVTYAAPMASPQASGQGM